MLSRRILIVLGLLLFLSGFAHTNAEARAFSVNARSAVLLNVADGDVLYQQNADALIAPASITKVLSLYIVHEAIEEGRLHLYDRVRVSREAAYAGGSRMGLKEGDVVTVEELIKGMAVVSGNDACVAMAEHMAGDVDRFVQRMNAKAHELGMTSSTFRTPNGLPAKGQLTTARDIARLSLAYLRRFPDSLSIHSMRSYTYNNCTHRNANRLLGTCPGVDGLKTGFVCSSGFNLSATARRGDTRLIAVVMGAQSPGIRAAETSKLLEAGFHQVNGGTDSFLVDNSTASRPIRIAGADGAEDSCPPVKSRKYIRVAKRVHGRRVVKTVAVAETCRIDAPAQKTECAAAQPAVQASGKHHARGARVTVAGAGGSRHAPQTRMVSEKVAAAVNAPAAKQGKGAGRVQAAAKAPAESKPASLVAQAKPAAAPVAAKPSKTAAKSPEVKKTEPPTAAAKAPATAQPKQSATDKKTGTAAKTNGSTPNGKAKRG